MLNYIVTCNGYLLSYRFKARNDAQRQTMKPTPVPVPSEIATTLAGARKARQTGQRALGKHLGISQAQISRIERGLNDPLLSTVQNLAGALDLDLMLVPRALGPVVSALIADHVGSPQASSASAKEQDRPLYQLANEEEDQEEEADDDGNNEATDVA
jgi:transcriptional regulator with XRE-family HTH domain